MSHALGQPVTLGPWLVYDSAGALANATTATLTITLPDGTTTSPAVANPPATTGTYTASYTPTLPGLHGVRITFTGTNATAPPLDAFYVDGGGATGLPPLASLAEAREQCRAYATADDPLLQRYLRVASDRAERDTQIWRRQTLTVTADGGSRLVRLKRPVISVTSVTEGGTAVTSDGWTLVAADGELYRGGAGALGQRWAAGTGNVVVTYVAGAADGLVPDGIRQGVLQLCEHLWNTQRGGSGLPRNNGGADWALPPGFTVPNAVLEQWSPWIRELAA